MPVPEAWSRVEVEATVAAYFEMLEQEIRGERYSKAECAKRLAPRLKRRSRGAIEYKHGNISAVLIDLGFRYVAGYKPAWNYQGLLHDVVAERLDANRALAALLAAQVAEEAQVPVVAEILSVLVDPPVAAAGGSRRRSGIAETLPVVSRIDYMALEARNRSLGDAGERFVVEYERARLKQAGCARLAASVEQVSKTRGDGLGYDVLSFDTNRRERFIEVKTTAFGAFTPFHVTSNELETSRKFGGDYHVYRAFEFRRRPKLFICSGPIHDSFSLRASEYLARVGLTA